jgi:large subunit ribosomal protein L22
MTGPKLNDGALVAGERVGTRATAKYVRSSASKARAVLDLIRGLDVRRASEVLRFSERGISADVAKVLDSAVANAIHNDAQDTDELFVVACYADEGPTLKRFRPRARGRATRIRKRTCHITIIVARMSDERIALLEARAEGRGGRTSAASRRDRVERSRRRAAAARAGGGAVDADDATTADADIIDEAEDEVEESELAEADDAETDDETVDAETADAETEEVDAHDEDDAEAEDATEAEDEAGTEEPEDDEAAAVQPVADLAGDLEAGEYEGSVVAPEDGSTPEGFEIKGNKNSMKYHTPESRYYDVTVAEVWFDTVEHAEAAGFEAPGGTTKTSDDEKGNQ